jgi:hypothetical protein
VTSKAVVAAEAREAAARQCRHLLVAARVCHPRQCRFFSRRRHSSNRITAASDEKTLRARAGASYTHTYFIREGAHFPHPPAAAAANH